MYFIKVRITTNTDILLFCEKLKVYKILKWILVFSRRIYSYFVSITFLKAAQYAKKL